MPAGAIRDISTPFTTAPLRSFVRLVAYFTIILIAIPIQAVLLLLKTPLSWRFPQWFHGVCIKIMGAKVIVKGRQVKEGPVLMVANHASYLDISVLGALIRGSFVAKAEVASWPVYGWCAKLSKTVFVDRNPRLAKEQTGVLRERLEDKTKLILFPEGTSNDGNRVLRFRSSLFAAAELEIDGKHVPVQPVSIAYTHLDGIPLGRHLRPFFAWYGDMEMLSHLWQLLGIGRCTVKVEFHEPVTIEEFGSRKELAAYCEAQVAAGVASAIAGRPQTPAVPPKRHDDSAPDPLVPVGGQGPEPAAG